MKRDVIGFVVAALLLAVATAVGWDFYRAMYATAVTEETTQFEIMPGESFDRVSERLADVVSLDSPRYWRFYARLSGADRRIKAGLYGIEAQTTPSRLLDDLVSGKMLLFRFTIYEGWTFRQILEAMRAHPQIRVEESDIGDISSRLGIAETSPEGWLYPDTYLFEKDIDYFKLLLQAHEIMKEKLYPLWEKRIPELPLASPYEALILASIVEKETAGGPERTRVAGVFITRLRRGMALQADPTVIYGVGEAFDGNLRKRDLRRDTPYNSYTRKGLPPTPIAMPSEKTIDAVLHPELTGELYFVAKGDGTHHFSKTYKEHLEAVRRYQLGGK